jgi:hypothetical protein
MINLSINPALRRAARISLALCAICLLLAPRAHADSIGANSLLQNSVLVAGSQSSVYSFKTSGAGVLTVHLENISWPERLAQLDCSIYSNAGFLHALDGSSEWKFVTTGAESFYASVLAGAGGRLNLGLFSIRVTFESAASLVPLPAAGWLLASVLGLFGFRRVLPTLRFMLERERFA